LIFSTDDTNSEIGIYDDRKESYSRLINDSANPCKLGFNRKNLIKGVSKENADCTESAYWNDGINPARFLNLTNLPYLITFKPDPSGGCDIETVTSNIDCEKLRLSPLLDIPSLTLEKSSISGALSNGSYRIALAYSSPTFRISDYLIISSPVYLFNQGFQSGALDLVIEGLDKDFQYYELILIADINQQTTARSIGFFPIEQTKVHVDIMKDENIVSLSSIVNQSVYYEGGDAMFKINDYLVQTGVRSKADINYQPQASKIRTKWVSYSVPEDYYKKSGNKVGYTKGEVFSPYIRFVYNTGNKTSSYPIIGREATNGEKVEIKNTDSKGIANLRRTELSLRLLLTLNPSKS